MSNSGYGDHFRALMEGAGLQPGEVATRAKVTPGMVSRYLAGTMPATKNAVAVARALGVSVDRLLDAENPPAPDRSQRVLNVVRHALEASEEELEAMEEALAAEAMLADEEAREALGSDEPAPKG